MKEAQLLGAVFRAASDGLWHAAIRDVHFNPLAAGMRDDRQHWDDFDKQLSSWERRNIRDKMTDVARANMDAFAGIAMVFEGMGVVEFGGQRIDDGRPRD